MEMCLKIFKVISRLKVNLDKSSMVSIHVDLPFLFELATLMGCKVDTWPMKYLGMPLGGNQKSMAFWDLMVEKVEKIVQLEEAVLT